MLLELSSERRLCGHCILVVLVKEAGPHAMRGSKFTSLGAVFYTRIE
jgi:hypothetical protein